MSGRAHDYGESSMDLASLAEIVEKFAGKKIVLFGDFVADEFQYGEISRVSREAPVLILRRRGTTVVPGGGANAANNLAALGAKVIPVTVVGDDAAGAALADHFRSIGVRPAEFFARRIGRRRRRRGSLRVGRTPLASRCCGWIANRKADQQRTPWPKCSQN